MPSDIHERLRGRAESWLEGMGYSTGGPRLRTPGYIPDALGQKFVGSRTRAIAIVEVETCESLERTHTVDQLSLMNDDVAVKRQDQGVAVRAYLVVPSPCLGAAQLLIRNLCLDNIVARRLS